MVNEIDKPNPAKYHYSTDGTSHSFGLVSIIQVMTTGFTTMEEFATKQALMDRLDELSVAYVAEDIEDI